MKTCRVATVTVLATFLLAVVACNESSPTGPSPAAEPAGTSAFLPRMPIQRGAWRNIGPHLVTYETPKAPPATLTPQTTPTRTTTATPPTLTPTATTTPTTPTPPPRVKYDGTYDLTLYACGNPCVGVSGSYTFPREFVVLNGNIDMFARSGPGVYTGAVTDFTFGTVRITGPCPTAAGGNAVFTGILNAGSGNKFGQGQYVCNGGIVDGFSAPWQVFNGY